MRSFQFMQVRLLVFWLLTMLCLPMLAQDTTRLSVVVVGDVMQHDSQIQSAYRKETGRYDYSYCFQHVASLINDADLAIGNLEVTLGGEPYKGYPQFSAPDELAIELKHLGFDALVTANNHCLDRGKKGLERTIQMLDSMRLQHTGTFRDSIERSNAYPLMLESKGFKLALLNYTYGTNGIPVPQGSIVNLIDSTLIKKDIVRAKELAPDIMMVFFHWGLEYQSQPSKEQRELAKLCLREGVQLVIGAHPHVLQPMEWNQAKDQLVVYSLGNFVSGQRTRYRDGGAIVNIELQKVICDSIPVVSIRDVNYDLVWVNASKPGGYTVLPVHEFEKDTTWSGAQTRLLLNTFALDARKLFSKYNVNVREARRPLIDSAYFQIVALDVTDSVANGNQALLKFYQARKNPSSILHSWRLGKFYDREVAVKALEDIQARLHFAEAQLWKFKWGIRSEEVATDQ